MPNNQYASITSKPLFIIVAESIVILLPIVQLGCFKARSFVIFLKSSFFNFLNGPPDAVKIIFLTLDISSPIKHCHNALCSLSTGKILQLFCLDKSINIFPA